MELSTWFGGKKENIYNGYLIDFNNNKVYCYDSIGLYSNQLETHALIKEISFISEQEKESIFKIIEDKKLLDYNIKEKLVMDSESTISISLDGKINKIKNAEARFTNGKIDFFDLLKKYIEDIISKKSK